MSSHYAEKILKIKEQKKKRDKQGDGEQNVAEPDLSRAESRLQYAGFMRLRQAVSHPFNLEKLLRTQITTKEIRQVKARFGESATNASILDQMMANEKNEGGFEGYQAGLNFLRQRKEPVFGGKFEWNATLDMFQQELEAQNSTCSSCEKSALTVRLAIQLEMVSECSVARQVPAGPLTKQVWPLLLRGVLPSRSSSRVYGRCTKETFCLCKFQLPRIASYRQALTPKADLPRACLHPEHSRSEKFQDVGAHY